MVYLKISKERVERWRSITLYIFVFDLGNLVHIGFKQQTGSLPVFFHVWGNTFWIFIKNWWFSIQNPMAPTILSPEPKKQTARVVHVDQKKRVFSIRLFCSTRNTPQIQPVRCNTGCIVETPTRWRPMNERTRMFDWWYCHGVEANRPSPTPNQRANSAQRGTGTRNFRFLWLRCSYRLNVFLHVPIGVNVAT